MGITTDELNVRLTADTGDLTQRLHQAGRDVTNFGETSEHAIDRAADSFDRFKGSVSSLGVGKAISNISTPMGELRYSLSSLTELFEAYANSINLEGAEEEVEELSDVTDEATSSMLDSFQELAGGITALGIGVLLKDVVTAAGELEQNLGGSSAVFKEYATTLQQYAAQAYQTMGLSQSQYLATANKMGALFQGSGFSIAESVDLTSAAMQRAADVASIMGIDVSTAMEAVAGAAKGNFTMMDNLGVAINDTTLQLYAQEKGLGDLETTQQKVNAAMMMFMEMSEYAAGNYARENETFAGSLQTFKAELQNAAAEIGAALLPTATQGIRVLTGIIGDLKPVITDVVSGIGSLGGVLGLLENPSVRTIAYTVAIAGAMNKLRMAVGGPLSAIVLLGSILTWLVGKFGQAETAADKTAEESAKAAEKTVESAMGTFAEATDGATDSAGKLNDELDKVGDTVKSMTAPFDEFTKMSGSSVIGSKLISADDVKNAENLGKELGALEQEYMVDVTVPDIEVPEIELPELGLPTDIDWDLIRKNLREWIDEQDWLVVWQDIGTGFETMFEATLAVIDGLFGTKLLELHEMITEKTFEWGTMIAEKVNAGVISQLNLEEEYEKQHGETPWQTFYKKVAVEGVDMREAFDSVFTTSQMKELFRDQYADQAAHWFKDDLGELSGEDVYYYLTGSPLQNFKKELEEGKNISEVFDKYYSTPALKQQFLDVDAYKLADYNQFEYQRILEQAGMGKAAAAVQSGKSYDEILKQMESDIKADIAAGMTGDEALESAMLEYYDGYGSLDGKFVSWYRDLPSTLQFEDKVDDWAAEYAKSGTINGNSVSAPAASAQDMYTMFSGWAMGGAPTTQFSVNLLLDEEVVGKAAVNYANGQVEVTNGKG